MTTPRTQLVLARPDAAEAAAWYHGYIAAVPDERIGDRLVRQVEELESIVHSLDDQAALARYAEGKWSIKEVVGHLTDAERIFAYRLLRVSRGDPTPLSGFDENAYVVAAHFDERPFRDLLAEFRDVRRSTLALVESIRPACWTLRGQANGQSISARALAYIIVGHVAHHIMVLQTRYGLDAAVRTASRPVTDI